MKLISAGLSNNVEFKYEKPVRPSLQLSGAGNAQSVFGAAELSYAATKNTEVSVWAQANTVNGVTSESINLSTNYD